jgi:DNA-binding IclR family transcriptional regulator
VGDRPEGSRLGELARAVALPKATVHRIVRALADEQLLWSDADGRIWLGPAIGRLAHASSAGLVARLHPVLVDLGQRVDETVDLSVLDGDRMRFVDQVASGHRLRAVSAVGTTFPLHCTANGKATLAALPDRTVELLLPATLERFTEHTVTDRRVLLAELDRVRSEGVAWDRQELSLGIAAVGVALCDGGGPVAAVSVPVHRAVHRPGGPDPGGPARRRTEGHRGAHRCRCHRKPVRDDRRVAGPLSPPGGSPGTARPGRAGGR